ncbi:hypothetical protein [Pedobacter sp. GR22-6]|uniref:hypothetical protein n=1 Tax=Pedobacter sp. GR22-6 TaxID=3127957 RepID=UPI00307DB777
MKHSLSYQAENRLEKAIRIKHEQISNSRLSTLIVAAMLWVMTKGNQTLRHKAISLTAQSLRSCTNRKS